jgi:hypothetical protein
MSEGKNPFKSDDSLPLPDSNPIENIPSPKPSFSDDEATIIIDPEPIDSPPPPAPPKLSQKSQVPINDLVAEQEMRDHDRKLILIGAGIALLISLLSFFVLNSLFSSNPTIENDSVTTPKIADQAVTKDKLADDALIAGPIGKTGPTGPAGKTGPRGPAGKSSKAGGLSGVEFTNAVSNTDSALAKSFNLTCPDGKRVIAGGAEVVDGNESVALSASTLSDDGLGWSARAIELESYPGKWFISINLTCAKTNGN